MLLDRFDNEIKKGVRILYPKIDESGNTKKARLSIYEVISTDEKAVTKQVVWNINGIQHIYVNQPHINAREIFPDEEVGKVVTLRYYKEAVVISGDLLPQKENGNESKRFEKSPQ